jgi:hypothetical protein
VLIDVLAEMVIAVGAPLLVNVAVLSGTVGVELQLVPVVHSAPGPCQVPSVACADVAASEAAAAVVANKYARIPLAPPAEMSQRRPACAYKPVDHPRARQCVLSQAAPICCSLWLCGHGCETNSGRAEEVIKYTIAVPAVASGYESAVDAVDGSSTRH